MQIEKVKIIIVDSHCDKGILEIHKADGKIYSDASRINVNKTAYGYSVIIPSKIFIDIDYSKYAASILKLFMKHIPNTIFKFTLSYYYESADEYYFDISVAKKVLAMNYFLGTINEMKSIKVFQFDQDEQNMEEIIDLIDSETDDEDDDEFDIEDDEYDDDEDEDDEYDEEDMDPFKFLMNGSYQSASPKRHKSKKSKDRYYDGLIVQTSRSLKHATKAKRSVNRHGVIIADSKNDIRKDEKIIRAFLKEFIPGGGWKKEFREDVLNRWMSSFVISKKRLSKVQKKYRKHKSRGRSSRVSSAMANMLIHNDIWNNPNK